MDPFGEQETDGIAKTGPGRGPPGRRSRSRGRRAGRDRGLRARVRGRDAASSSGEELAGHGADRRRRGFRWGRIGERVIGRASVILKSENVAIEVLPIRNHPDEAGLIGAVHLAPKWIFEGHDAILAVDVGGTNVRAGSSRSGRSGRRTCRRRASGRWSDGSTPRTSRAATRSWSESSRWWRG